MNKNKKNKLTVTSKVEEDTVAKYQKMAERNGTTLSAVVDQTLREAVSLATLNTDIGCEYVKDVNNFFIDKMGAAPSTNLILHLAFINFLAQNRAEMKIFGDLFIQKIHFVFRQDGEMLTGDKLMEHLEKQYIETFTQIKEFLIKDQQANAAIFN